MWGKFGDVTVKIDIVRGSSFRDLGITYHTVNAMRNRFIQH